MKIVIMGAGEVGFQISTILSKEGHELTIIEMNPARVLEIDEMIDAMTIVGNGANADTLISAGIKSADAFIAATNKDEVNILTCLMAKGFGVKTTIARINTVGYNKTIEQIGPRKLGVDFFINPHESLANEICTMVNYIQATDVATFARGNIIYLTFLIEESNPVVGLKIKELVDGDIKFVLTKVVHKEKVHMPDIKREVIAGDKISLICKTDDVSSVRKILGLDSGDARKVFILGAGPVGKDVAAKLTATYHTVKLIDKDSLKCKQVAEELNKTLVICATNTDSETLKAEGAENFDVYISLTGDDQTNILGGLLAKKLGVKRAISVVNQPDLVDLSYALGIDSCISERQLIASEVLKYLRGDLVWTVARLDNNITEVIEFQIPENSFVADLPLKDLDIPEGVRIGAIFRDTESIIPSGADHLKTGDHVIVFSMVDSIKEAEKFFS